VASSAALRTNSSIGRSASACSTAPRMRSPVVELLAALSGALESIAARWYLFGAQAAPPARCRAPHSRCRRHRRPGWSRRG
jgi:hypothetical protein